VAKKKHTMKAGTEVHYLAGQIFTLGIAAVAILPRMPGDSSVSNYSIGGKLSYPFRRALIGLVCVGWIRVLGCHVLFSSALMGETDGTFSSSINNNSAVSMIKLVDAMLGTIHVVGQTFLCLTTAYLLQRQLSDFVNVDVALERQFLGGSSLPASLVIVSLLTFGGAFLSELSPPNYWCLVNLAEAYSCFPVLNTLKVYASVTTRTTGTGNSIQQQSSGGRGPVLTQILMTIEY